MNEIKRIPDAPVRNPSECPTAQSTAAKPAVSPSPSNPPEIYNVGTPKNPAKVDVHAEMDLEQTADYWSYLTNEKRRTYVTIWRWTKDGYKGTKLPAQTTPRGTFVKQTAVVEFCNKVFNRTLVTTQNKHELTYGRNPDHPGPTPQRFKKKEMMDASKHQIQKKREEMEILEETDKADRLQELTQLLNRIASK